MLKWPQAEHVLAEAREWARRTAAAAPGIYAIGCFGSYARGDAGVGSDLDLIAIVAAQPHETGTAAWATEHLPVPVELLIYTIDQWQELSVNSRRFFDVLTKEARWLVGSPPKAA